MLMVKNVLLQTNLASEGTAIKDITKLAVRSAEGNWWLKKLCELVTLDIKNAFNSLRWPVIDEALRRKGIPKYLMLMIRSWLSDSGLLAGDQRTCKSFTFRRSPGFCLRIDSANVTYNELLTREVPPGAHLVDSTTTSLWSVSPKRGNFSMT